MTNYRKVIKIGMIKYFILKSQFFKIQIFNIKGNSPKKSKIKKLFKGGAIIDGIENEKNKEVMYLTNDYVFHRVFGSRGNEKITYRKILLTDTLEVHIIELPKLIEQIDKNEEIMKDKAALWALFILNPENIGEEIMNKNEDLKLAKEELEKLKQDEHERYLAELRMKHIRDSMAIEEYGFDRGLEQGRTEGKKEKQREIAKKLRKFNMPIKQISEITDLTEEEIKNIQ